MPSSIESSRFTFDFRVGQDFGVSSVETWNLERKEDKCARFLRCKPYQTERRLSVRQSEALVTPGHERDRRGVLVNQKL